MTLEYIFDPRTARSILQLYPKLHQRLAEPAVEGRKAVNFQARKTPREIYRVLSNQHYQHLADLLSTVEYCLKSGFEAPKLLKTNVRQDFASSVSELLLAEYFLRRGFSVRSPESEKGNEVVPDLVVDAAVPISIEVYTPRDWMGMNDFVEDLRIGILHLDLPWDFHFEILIELISHFDHDENPLWFNPWNFSEATETPKQRFTKIAPALAEIEAKLSGSNDAFIIKRLDHEHNISVEVRFEEIQRSERDLPSRSGGISVPTLTGHAPEVMFDQFVERRLLKKIRSGQAQSIQTGGLAAVFVDVNRLGYSYEFSHPWYRKKFSQSLEKHLEHGDLDIDVVAFYLSRVNEKTVTEILLLFLKSGIPDDVLDMLMITRPE